MLFSVINKNTGKDYFTGVVFIVNKGNVCKNFYFFPYSKLEKGLQG